MRKVKCAFSIFIIAVIICCSCFALASCTDVESPEEENPEEASKATFVIPNAKELVIPPELENFGLFYEKDGVAYNILDENLPEIDESKPIIVYIHGMKSDRTDLDMVSFPSAEEWEDYNTFIFNWSPFCDGDTMNPFGVGAGEWSRDQILPYRYTDENGEKAVATSERTAEVMKHSIAEVFVSNYVYLMETHNFTTNSIQISGHSMGGQLVAAIASYTFYAYENGGLDAKYMPSAFYMLDPFMESYDITSSKSSKKMIVDWSGEDLSAVGSAGLAYNTMKKGEELGVPVCYLRSGFVHTFISTSRYETIQNDTVYIDLDASYLDTAGSHAYAPDWFYTSNKTIIMEENSNKTNFGLTAATHFSYLLGMTGAHQHLINNDDLVLSNDKIEALNATPAIINGYVFNDANGNGLFDEQYANRLYGKEVEIYADGNKIATVTTNAGGYYRYEIPTEYLSSTLKIRVNGTPATLGATVVDNALQSNGYSNEFSLESSLQAVLLNVGIAE